MNKHFLKSLRDNMPEFIKYIATPVFRNKLIKNKEFQKYYALLENRDFLSTEIIKEYQFNELKNILIYSYQNVPYYRELFNKISFNPHNFSDFEQIKTIPFLTREIINNNFDRLISTGKIKNGYYTAITGGSTGLPLKLLLDYDSIFKENAFIYYFRKKLGYKFGDKLATFRTNEYGSRLWKYNPMYNEIIFFPRKLSKVTILKIVQKFENYNPLYLNGYLSAIWYFAKLLEEYKINLSIKFNGIFLISENLDDSRRTFIEQFFNTKTLTFYGHSERCVIAEEITPNIYKFDPYYGYTEKIQLEDNQFSIVGTGFLNHVMPFIRYRTDDICSSNGQFDTITGKRNRTLGLYGKNDEFLPSTAWGLEDPVFKNITTYQFIQGGKGKAELLIIVNKDYKISELEVIKKKINQQCKGIIEIEVKIVENLNLSPRGKYQMYISNISHGNA
jgi:phenylacetate-CoA ligase